MSNIEPRFVKKLRKKKQNHSKNKKKGVKSLSAAILGAFFLTYFMFKFVYILIQFEGFPPNNRLYRLWWFALIENLLFGSAGLGLITYGISVSKE